MSQPSSTTTSKLKRAAAAVGAAALGLVVAGLALELALQPAPVHAGIPFRRVDAADPVLRGEADRPWVHSVGWSLFNARTGRTNNLGFNDPQAFQAGAPVVAVLGDSYVEAQAVPYPSSLQGRLRAYVGDAARVYGFGVSGAAASDYVAYLRWARQRLDVRSAVVVVTASDLEEATGPRPGMHHFVRQADGQVALERVDRPAATPLMKALNTSKLYRYVFANLGFDPTARVAELFARPGAEADAPPPDNAWVVDAFLDGLSAELPPGRITLALDADREAIAAGDAPEHPPERALLIEQARARGFTVVDLEGPIRAHSAAGGRKLDFSPMDGHWNALGHRLAAESVAAAWRSGHKDPSPPCGRGRRSSDFQPELRSPPHPQLFASRHASCGRRVL